MISNWRGAPNSNDFYKVAFDILRLITLRSEEKINRGIIVLDKAFHEALTDKFIEFARMNNSIAIIQADRTNLIEMSNLFAKTCYTLTVRKEVCVFPGCIKSALNASNYCKDHANETCHYINCADSIVEGYAYCQRHINVGVLKYMDDLFES